MQTINKLDFVLRIFSSSKYEIYKVCIQHVKNSIYYFWLKLDDKCFIKLKPFNLKRLISLFEFIFDYLITISFRYYNLG